MRVSFLFVLIFLSVCLVLIWNNRKKRFAAEDKDKNGKKLFSAAYPDNPSLVTKLVRLYEEEKIYLNPNLRITDVMRKLYINRNYVTRIIQRDLQANNFQRFTNKYRVKESMKLLNKGKYTVDQIAAMSGFQNRMSFYRAFKEETGLSPSQWKRQQNNGSMVS